MYLAFVKPFFVSREFRVRLLFPKCLRICVAYGLSLPFSKFSSLIANCRRVVLENFGVVYFWGCYWWEIETTHSNRMKLISKRT